LLAQAVSFLQQSDASLADKLNFLEIKGLTNAEVREALRRVELRPVASDRVGVASIGNILIEYALPAVLVLGTGLGLFALTTQSSYFDSEPPVDPLSQQQLQHPNMGMGTTSSYHQGQESGTWNADATDFHSLSNLTPFPCNGQIGNSSSGNGHGHEDLHLRQEMDELKASVREAVSNLGELSAIGALSQQPDWARELTALARQLVKDVNDMKNRVTIIDVDNKKEGKEKEWKGPSEDTLTRKMYHAVWYMIENSSSSDDTCVDTTSSVGYNDDNVKNANDVGKDHANTTNKYKEKDKDKNKEENVHVSIHKNSKTNLKEKVKMEMNSSSSLSMPTLSKALLSCLSAITMYVTKIVENPDVPRYRRLASQNKTFRYKLS
jgi:hypothetical protein